VSNMVRVLGEEAYLDPTGAEKKAKAEMAVRKAEHDKRCVFFLIFFFFFDFLIFFFFFPCA
jgi:hypothetical protein